MFFRKTPKYDDFSCLGVDFHSHLVPGIDDGAKTMDESLELLRGLYELGYTHVVTTPHINSAFYPNDRTTILAGLEQLQAAVLAAGIPIELGGAAEYYIDEHFENLLHQEALLPVFDDWVLVETSFFGAPPNLHELLFRMQTKGYRPILAHPERYAYLAVGDLRPYRELRERGCRLQVNLLSLNGHYGPQVQKTAEQLLRAGLVDYLCTDLHHQHHLQELPQVLERKVFRKFAAHVKNDHHRS